MNWNKIKMEERLNIYGEKYFQDMWRACLDSMNIIYDQKNGDICATEAKLVTCPTLLLHGTRDTVVSRRHFEILANLIKHAE